MNDEPKLEMKLATLLESVEAAQKDFARTDGKHRRVAGESVVVDAPGVLTRTVDEYVSPRGVGYLLVLEYQRDGETWRRVVQRGPEPWRETGWRNVTPLKTKENASRFPRQ